MDKVEWHQIITSANEMMYINKHIAGNKLYFWGTLMHGNAFPITGPLWVEPSAGQRWIP